MSAPAITGEFVLGLALVCFLVVFAAAGCRTARVTTSPNPVIIVLPDASEARTSKVDHGSVTTYRLSVAYPAEGTIEQIRARLREAGWRPSDRPLVSPDSPNSVTAVWRRVQSGNGDMWGWSEQWESQPGEVVVYTLGYTTTTAGNPEPSVPLEVSIFLFEASAVRELRRR